MSTPSPVRLVRLVLFDVDGTLVDHAGATAAAVQQWLLAMGWADAGTIASLVSGWDEIAERHFSAYGARLTTFQGQRRLRLREFLPRVGIDASTWSDGRLDELFNTYLDAYEAAWRPFPDAEPCLEALLGVAQVAVLSNGSQEQQERKVSRTGLDRYVDVVLTSDQLGVAKPDPRAFGLACARLGVPARAAVYIGDQLKVDALAATAAGLRGIWLNRTGDGVPPGVEAVNNLTDLPSLLENHQHAREHTSVVIRPYEYTDAAETLAVFILAVTETASADYTAEQVQAWAQPERRDVGTWHAAMLARSSIVATIGGVLAGFSDGSPDGDLDMMFVSPRHQRRGVARQLLAHVEARARSEGTPALSVDASITARSFFERHGFTVEAEQHPVKAGVELTNYKMRKELRQGGVPS